MTFSGGSRFELVRCLGHGGMGVVYEAREKQSGARVALKTLLRMDGDGLLRFKNEFRALQDLHHRNLVSLGELVEEDGSWFFTMELVDGVDFLTWVAGAPRHAAGTSRAAARDDAPTSAMATDATLDGSSAATGAAPALATDETMAGAVVPGLGSSPAAPHPTPQPVIRRRASGTFDEARLRAALAQLAEGLIALHDAGKVHRDIKPSNVMVGPDGRVVLLDFGVVANLVQRTSSEDGMVGTTAYMAPEQARAVAPGPAADWYSVGVVLFEAMTGTLPFKGKDSIELLMRKNQLDPPAPSTLVSGLPPDLEELCLELLARDPAARPGGREVLARLIERPSLVLGAAALDVPTGAPFVGRRAELDALRAALADTRGRPIVALVHGESGVGKSALVGKFLDEALARSPRTVLLSGRCYERESVPYKAVDGVIDELSHFLVREPTAGAFLPRRAALLAQIFPVLERVDVLGARASGAADALEPHELRARAFAALAELLERVARARPLIVAIDDLQWADPDSLALLEEVLRGPDAPPLLLLATVREGASLAGERLDAAGLAARLPAEVRPIHVSALGADEAVELASALGAPTAAETIAREAAGHPLYIAELARHSRQFGDAGGPRRLDDALWHRVERLEPATRAVIELVAAGGLPVQQQVAAHALGVEVAELARHLAPLRADSLVRTTGPRPTDLVEPYHDRVREAVVQHLAAERVAACHRRLAGALVDGGAPDPERLAFHWQGAGEPERAAAAYLLAARKAEKALAFDRAAAFYRLALELRTVGGDDGRALRAALADALANAGRGAEAAAAYLDASQGAEPDVALDRRLRAAEQLLRAGQLDEGLEVVGGILDGLAIRIPSTPKRALLSLLVQRARVRLRGLRFDERPEADVDRAVLRRIDACWSLALSFGHVDPIRGADIQTRHLRFALEAGEPYRIARSLGAEAIFASTDGRSARRRAADLVAASRRLSDRVGHPHADGMSAMAEGMAAYFVGEWKRALDGLDRAIAIYRERCVGVARELVTAQMFSLWALSYLGRVEETGRRLAAWVREADLRSDRYAATSMRLGMMNLTWLARDDVDGAREELRVAMGPWSHEGGMQFMDQLMALVHIDLYAGDPAAGHQRVTAAWPALVRAMLLMVQVSRVEMKSLRGKSALATAVAAPDRPDRARLLRAAARDGKALRGEKLPWAAALGELLLAGVAATRGDADRALASATAAAHGFEEADMALHAAVARRARGRLLGGDEGGRLVADAERWMRGNGVVAPARIAATLGPGLDG